MMLRRKCTLVILAAVAAFVLCLCLAFNMSSPGSLKPVRVALQPSERSLRTPLCDNSQPPIQSAPSTTEAIPTSNLHSQDAYTRRSANLSLSSPTIFVITPTYARSTQKADLVRLCQTLMNVDNLCWIVIEDSTELTPLVTRLLQRCKVWSVQLHAKTPEAEKPKKKMRRRRGRKKQLQSMHNRGGEQRNKGLQWLRDTFEVGEIKGVVYFGDDDNTYDIQLFEEMRGTERVSVWPVGLVGGLGAEGPVCENDTVVQWHASWAVDRVFPVDFAGFAIHIDVLLSDPKILVNPKSPIGYMETAYLEQIVTEKEELEAKAENCTQVYVWHTQTKTPQLPYEKKNPSNVEF